MIETKPILFEGKFSKANLWKIEDVNDPTAQITLKKDIFRWMRDWGFANSKAEKPEEYLYGMRCLVEDQYAAGLKLDPKKSQGDRLVAYPIPEAERKLHEVISRESAEKLAKEILGLNQE